MGIHKVPVEGGDEEDGVMEAWCYRHAHGVKRVELNVDGNVVAWLRIVEGAKEEINHDNGLFGAGDRICVRGRFDQIGLVPELDFET
jgi:hypothetical protein